MTEDIEFLRSMAAACRKEARAERRRRPREELMLFAERIAVIADRFDYQSAYLASIEELAYQKQQLTTQQRAENA